MKMKKKEIGDFGERESRKWLEMQGYKTIHEKFTSPFGEIDLIMKKENTVVFIEVKTRTSLAYGTPGESITQKKKEHMKKTALYFLSRYEEQPKTVRFDVMEWYIGHQKGVMV